MKNVKLLSIIALLTGCYEDLGNGQSYKVLSIDHSVRKALVVVREDGSKEYRAVIDCTTPSLTRLSPDDVLDTYEGEDLSPWRRLVGMLCITEELY